jgi:peptidyl-tRNA hydrolase, PTH1 family
LSQRAAPAASLPFGDRMGTMGFGRRQDRERRGTPADLLVVGLGNPGSQYQGSRHNVGFDVVELLARRHGGRLRGVKGLPAVGDEVRIGGKRVALVMPTTYMNDSGQAVAPLVRRFGIDDPARLVVVHDELDLPPGRLRVKLGGGLAGHNGLRSITSHCHTDAFARLRIGVGKPPSADRGADHVLRRVPAAERKILDVAVERAADAAECILTEGVEVAMTRYNGITDP